jgi:ATP-binding cassette subfamily B protein
MRRMIVSVSVPQGIVLTVLQSGVLLVAAVGMRLLGSGELSLTRFVLALVLSNAFAAAAIKYMSYEHAGLLLNRAAGNIFGIMGEKPALGDRGAAPENGDIVFDHVSFGYDGRGNALSDVSATFRRGGVNAVVGASGSGKTTIANLIMGFWQPDAGSVTIGGKDVSQAGDGEL